MRAILLAAGEGSRLRPLTVNKPKPMIRAANKPIAQHAVEALVENGVRDITFVLGYHREKVQSYFGDGARFGARIKYAFQDALLGTAHALATAPPPDEHFLVLGADNVVDAALIKRAVGAPAGLPAMVVHRSDDPRRYGVVTCEGDLVTGIEEKPADPRSEWVNTGVYRFPAEYFTRIRQLARSGLVGLPDVLKAMLDKGEQVHAVRSDDLWVDAVHPWDLLRVHADLLRNATPPEAPPGVSIEPPVQIGENVTLGPGVVLGAGTCIGDNVTIRSHCVIEGSVVYDDVQIEPFSYLQNSIIGEGARLGPRFTALSGRTDVHVGERWHSLDDFGCVVGEDVVAGGNVTILPGAIVGNRARIAANRVVRTSLPDGAVAE